MPLWWQKKGNISHRNVFKQIMAGLLTLKLQTQIQTFPVSQWYL
jgi:hypothetical protein